MNEKEIRFEVYLITGIILPLSDAIKVLEDKLGIKLGF